MIAATTKSKKRMKPIRVLFLFAFTIIPTIHFLLFYVYVNINSFTMGFRQTVDGETVWRLANFTRFFDEFGLATSELSIAFKNTFITFGISLIMFVVGFFVSYFLYKKVMCHRVIRILFFLPSVIAGTVVSSFYMKLVGVDGPIAPIIQKIMGLDYVPTLLADERFSNQAVWAHMIWLGFPGNMIIWGGTFSRIPDSVIESSRLDGVNWVQEAMRIIIPIVWPTFALMFLLTFANVFGAGGAVFLLTKGEAGTQTLSNWMYMQVYNSAGGQGNSNVFNYLSAVGLLLSIVSIAIALTVRGITSRFNRGVEY